MIRLYISTIKKVKTSKICEILKNKEVEFQIYKNYSYSKKNIEKGYKLLLFNIDKTNFKEKVWNSLEKLLNLQCAFVIYDNQYMGCVRNWPGVFVKSNCPNYNLKQCKDKLNEEI